LGATVAIPNGEEFGMSRHYAWLVGVMLAASTTAFGLDAEDKKWIAQCRKDKANPRSPEGGEPLKKYCACMNDKMSDDETKSVVEWEPTHKKEMEACKKSSGYKD
jgi:hypothetical protein